MWASACTYSSQIIAVWIDKYVYESYIKRPEPKLSLNTTVSCPSLCPHKGVEFIRGYWNTKDSTLYSVYYQYYQYYQWDARWLACSWTPPYSPGSLSSVHPLTPALLSQGHQTWPGLQWSLLPGTPEHPGCLHSVSQADHCRQTRDLWQTILACKCWAFWRAPSVAITFTLTTTWHSNSIS